jgi:sensor histidine kinase YesM
MKKPHAKYSWPTSAESHWIKDVIFSVAAYFVLLSIFAGSSKWQMIDHIYTSIFLATLILFGTFNAWILQPRFLDRNKYGIFIVLTTVNILIGALFNHLLFDKLIDYILPGYYFISYYSYGDLVKFFFVYVFLITLLDLSWEWFQFQETRHRMTVLEKEKISAELKALTNQVNPHFLFNSLTVLYSLALRKSAETPDAIIKLSDILRYVIYESAGGEVPLRSEVSLLHNYIDLQRYRIDPSASIRFTTDIQNENIPVASMLFLPLLENSFKHGVKGDISGTFIHMDLKSADGVITFRIENNKSKTSSGETPSGGIGMKNIQERLKLMYGDRFSFSIANTDTSFAVNLQLKPLI